MADAVADQAPSPSDASIDPTAVTPVADQAAKPAEAAATDKLAEKPVEAVKPVIPEKYDFAALKLPDGIALNNDLVEAVSPIFKKHGLTQEAANELVQTHAEALAKAEATAEVKREADFKDWMKDQVTQHQAAMKKEWGLAYDANLVMAQKGIARIMSPAAKALLDETGLGNHPEFVKAFYQVGKMVSEDTPPNGGAPAGSRKSAEQVLYGSTTTN